MTNEVVPNASNANLPAEWADRMAVYAKEGLSNERSAGNLFSTKSGILTFGGVAVPNNKMQVVVVAAMFENVYYAKPYDASAPASPDCYAFSFDGRKMAPHDEAETKQNPTCDGCKWNEWDTGPNGKGKACKELRRLALLPASSIASAEGVADGTVGYLRLPVTSAKAFSEHVKHIGMKGLPVFAVVSEVQLSPHPKHMWQFTFSIVAPIADGNVLAALEKRHFGEKAAMAFPYPKVATAVAQAAQAPANRKF